MWIVPAQVFRDYHDNITFGLNVDHWDKDQWDVLSASPGPQLSASKLQQCCKDWQLFHRAKFCQAETKKVNLVQEHTALPPYQYAEEFYTW